MYIYIHEYMHHINIHVHKHIVYKSRLCSEFSYLKIQNMFKKQGNLKT